MDDADVVINQDHPVVQDAERDNHLELVLPSLDATIEMHHTVFLAIVADGMRCLTEDHGRT